MEISVGLFADFHQQFLVVHGAHELDAGVLVKAGFLFQFLAEAWVYGGDQGKALGGLAQHELADHGLVVVLGYESTHHQVVVLGLKVLVGEPLGELGVVVGQLAPADFCTVGDKGGVGVELAVRLVDVLFDVLAVAHQQVGLLYHEALGDFPVLAHGQGPLGSEPFMAVGVHVELAAQGVDLFLELCRKGADSAGQAVHDGVLDVVLPDIADAALDCFYVVDDGLRGSDVGDLYVETTCIVVFKFVVVVCSAGDMVLESGIVLMVFSQFVYECLVAAVCAWNAFAANDENMLNIFHHSPLPKFLKLNNQHPCSHPSFGFPSSL